MLERTKKSDELVIELDSLPGYWLQAQFHYNRKKMEAEVYNWVITDCAGAELALQSIKYKQFEQVASEVAELMNLHLAKFAEVIEDDYVAGRAG